VHSKLFETGDLSIEKKSRRTLETSVEKVMEQLLEAAGETGIEESEVSLYFRPMESKYLVQSDSSLLRSELRGNPHFTYIGEKRDFLKIESVPIEQISATNASLPTTTSTSGSINIHPSKGHSTALPSFAKPSSSLMDNAASNRPSSSRSFFGMMPTQKKTIERITVDKVIIIHTSMKMIKIQIY
jgi:hypothetical protein